MTTMDVGIRSLGGEVPEPAADERLLPQSPA